MILFTGIVRDIRKEHWSKLKEFRIFFVTNRCSQRLGCTTWTSLLWLRPFLFPFFAKKSPQNYRAKSHASVNGFISRPCSPWQKVSKTANVQGEDSKHPYLLDKRSSKTRRTCLEKRLSKGRFHPESQKKSSREKKAPLFSSHQEAMARRNLGKLFFFLLPNVGMLPLFPLGWIERHTH